MKKVAFVVYDSEFRHRRLTVRLRRYFLEIGVPMVSCPVTGLVIRELRKVLEEKDKDTILLLIYAGHGSIHGWSGTKKVPAVPYVELVELLQKAGPLMVVNDTCHGLRLLTLLKESRSDKDTAFLAPFGSRHVTYAAAINDLLQNWPYGKRLEDSRIGVLCLRADGSEHEYAPQARWGAPYDQHFFGNRPRRVSARGEPIQLGLRDFIHE